MFSDANSSRLSGVTISCDVPVKALYEIGYKYELENEAGNIYIIDEDFGPLKSKEFAAIVLKSENCFILITRESLPTIPYSYREIYEIKTSGKYHSLENIYPKYDNFQDSDHINRSIYTRFDSHKIQTISPRIFRMETVAKWNVSKH